METNLFDVKYRIFKRERVREGKNNLVIVPKNTKINKKNQIEFVWTNTGLKGEHLSILGTAMVNEWGRILPDIVISRAFIQIKENQKIRLYISFQVEDNLTNDEIKEIMLKSLKTLNECLEKITKRVIGESEFKQLLLTNEQKKANTNEGEDFGSEIEEDELIRKLHSEIMMQEELLSKLAQQQKEQENSNQEEMIVENQSKVEFEKYTETIERLYTEISMLEKTADSLTKELISTEEKRQKLEKDNLLLKADLEKVKKTQIANSESESSQKIMILEKNLQELKKENSDYRIKLLESQSIVDQYIFKNKYLTESYEKAEREKKEFIEHAQTENKEIQEALKESEKKLALMTNNYQKDHENLERLRKQLVETTIESDEKISQFNTQITQLKKENDQLSNATKELEVSLSHVNRLEQELKLAETTIDVIKKRKEKATTEFENDAQITVWRKKYEELLSNYSKLEQDGRHYRQEITFLNAQLTHIEHKIKKMIPLNEDVTTKMGKTERYQLTESSDQLFGDQSDTTDEDIGFFIDADDEYHYFTYESDPYVKKVEAVELKTFAASDQIEEQEIIYDLFKIETINETREIKIKKSEYKKYLSDVRFLSYRWSQIINRNTMDINTEFLKWCDPLIEQIDFFEESLGEKVKNAFLTKNYVVMKESVYQMLKGYSRLYSYLDTYCILS